MHSSETSQPLLTIVRNLGCARDLEGIMAIVREGARRVSGADGVTFVLRQGDMCYYADEEAIAPLWKGRRFPLNECISGWVLQRGEPVVIPDVFADGRIPHAAYAPTFVKSLVMVPVRTPDPVAAIGAYWASPHAAGTNELRALQLVAESAALALANVRLHEELRAALERERQAQSDASTSAKAKDNFLAILSHELRQPLSACTAAAALLKTRNDPSTVTIARGVIDRQLRQMTRMVGDLLDASRIVRGDVTLDCVETDLRAVVSNAVETIAPSLEAHAHALEMQLPAEPCLLNVDAARLEQVLVNLLSNAVKYTPRGGFIHVSLTMGKRATIRVRDNGEGIEVERLSQIFELFTRAGAASQPGLGIGLAIAQRLVQEHGGTLTAHSDGPGTGSEMVIELPRTVARPRRQRRRS